MKRPRLDVVIPDSIQIDQGEVWAVPEDGAMTVYTDEFQGCGFHLAVTTRREWRRAIRGYARHPGVLVIRRTVPDDWVPWWRRLSGWIGSRRSDWRGARP